MPAGYPKDNNKRQVWNGSGMAALTPARRKEIGEKSAKNARERRSGWPKPVAYLSDPDYYAKTNDEYMMRVELSRMRSEEPMKPHTIDMTDMW